MAQKQKKKRKHCWHANDRSNRSLCFFFFLKGENFIVIANDATSCLFSKNVLLYNKMLQKKWRGIFDVFSFFFFHLKWTKNVTLKHSVFDENFYVSKVFLIFCQLQQKKKKLKLKFLIKLKFLTVSRKNLLR